MSLNKNRTKDRKNIVLQKPWPMLWSFFSPQFVPISVCTFSLFFLFFLVLSYVFPIFYTFIILMISKKCWLNDMGLFLNVIIYWLGFLNHNLLLFLQFLCQTMVNHMHLWITLHISMIGNLLFDLILLVIFRQGRLGKPGPYGCGTRPPEPLVIHSIHLQLPVWLWLLLLLLLLLTSLRRWGHPLDPHLKKASQKTKVQPQTMVLEAGFLGWLIQLFRLVNMNWLGWKNSQRPANIGIVSVLVLRGCFPESAVLRCIHRRPPISRVPREHQKPRCPWLVRDIHGWWNVIKIHLSLKLT